MGRLTSELSEMFAKSHKLEDEIRKNLGRLGMKYNWSIKKLSDIYINPKESIPKGTIAKKNSYGQTSTVLQRYSRIYT